MQSIKLPDSLFWDADPGKLDPDTGASYIIERVISSGTFEDWKEIVRFYGDEKIKTTILNLRYLDRINLNFFSIYFNIPKEQFRCYNTPQSIRQLWDF
ncbi:MAG: hypothetical protein QG635_1362 [Bacteroidota bacterium]|nr:hypothetical protein [Bacteroidota bacterium]